MENTTPADPNELITVYELDFGDTNVIDPNYQEIADWIGSEISRLKDGEEYECKITCKKMTRKEVDELPDWN